MPYCQRCESTKDLSQFYKDVKSVTGYEIYCKSCARARKASSERKFRHGHKVPNSKRLTLREHNTGILEHEYEILLRTQKNVCKICGNSNSQNLAVDHCHSTGIVRGLLCRFCNTGLGFFKDDIVLMEKAIQYLKSSKTQIPYMKGKTTELRQRKYLHENSKST